MKRRGARQWRWFVIPLLVAALVLLPIGVVVASWRDVQGEVWAHLVATQLPGLVANTLFLLAGVGVGVTCVGVGLAWLIVSCEFPGRRFLDWGLMLPLAVPAYVLSFVVLGQWDYLGPVQQTLRHWYGPDFGVDVRHPLTVVLVLTGVFYPYVYMLSRAAFIAQGSDTLEAARSLGLTPAQAFWRVSLPMARPAIFAGVSLALMETLADFGAVSVFNFDTFTTAIYKTWFGFFNLQAAAQLASLLLLFVVLALGAERLARGGRRFDQPGRGFHHQRMVLRGWRRCAAVAVCFGIFTAVFAVPVVQLACWVFADLAHALDPAYWRLLSHTLILSLCAAGLTVALALLMSVSIRQQGGALLKGAGLLGNLGYALPGSVLAVGVTLGLSGVETGLYDLLGWQGPLLLAGGLGGLMLAYIVRFMAVAHGPIDAGLQQVRPGISEAAQLLGAGPLRLVTRVYLPMIAPGVLTATLLVLVDVMKEMPATLLLRPFGWDTLAVKVYELTSEGEWQRAAMPALTIVAAGLLPVVLLIRRQLRGWA